MTLAKQRTFSQVKQQKARCLPFLVLVTRVEHYATEKGIEERQGEVGFVG